MRIEQGIGDARVRRSEHGRIALDPRFLRRVPSGGRLGPIDAHQRGRCGVEGPGLGMRGRAARGRSPAQRHDARATDRLPRPPAGCRCRSARSCSSSLQRRGDTSARTRVSTILNDICTGKAIFGMDAHRDGMVYASIEHPPVYGGKVKSFDDKEALQVRGVRQTVTIDPLQASAHVSTAGRRGRDRRQHLGGLSGPQEAEGRLGSRSTRRLRFRAFQEGTDRTRSAQPGKAGPQSWQRRRGICARAARSWRRSTTRPIWPTRRWSRPRPSPSSGTTP